jgi:hypothetical protein
MPIARRISLVQPLGRRHRSLDCQTANVLPPFFQQTDQVVDRQHDVRDQLILSHAHIADCHPDRAPSSAGT